MNEKVQQANQLFVQGDHQRAAQLLIAVLQTNPNDYQAWYGLALCHHNLEKKISCLQKCLAIKPDYEQAQQLWANLKTDTIDFFSPLSKKHQIRVQSELVSLWLTWGLLGLLVFLFLFAFSL